MNTYEKQLARFFLAFVFFGLSYMLIVARFACYYDKQCIGFFIF